MLTAILWSGKSSLKETHVSVYGWHKGTEHLWTLLLAFATYMILTNVRTWMNKDLPHMTLNWESQIAFTLHDLMARKKVVLFLYNR